MKRLSLSLFSALASSSFLFACGNASSTSAAPSASALSASATASALSVKDQCAAFNKANDEWSDKLTKRKDSNDAAKDARAMAKDIEDWSATLGKLPIQDTHLHDLATDEQTVLKNEASSLKDVASLMVKMDALKSSADTKGAETLQKQMDAIEKNQDKWQAASDTVDKKIEEYCADK